MPFTFNREDTHKYQETKIREAEQRTKEVFRKHPDLLALDEKIKEKEIRLRSSVLFKVPANQREQLKKELSALKKEYNSLIEKKRIPKDFKEPRWDCPICQDRGELISPDGFIPCSCRQQDYLNKLRKNSGLPRRFFSASFTNACLDFYAHDNNSPTPRTRAERAYAAARRFVKNLVEKKETAGLFIDGPVGSGKTYLMACITNALLEKEVAVRFFTYSEFLFALKMSFDPDSPLSEYHLVSEVQKAPLLIMDDLGAEPATEFSSATLYRIIAHRYNEEKPFLVNSSCSPPELEKRLGYLGEKIIKRIMETCDYYRLEGDVRRLIIDMRRKENGKT